MGQDLAKAGIEVAGIFEKIGQAEEDGEMLKWQQNLDNAASDYHNKMVQSPNDAQNWALGFDEVMAKKRGEMEQMGVSRRLRRRLDEHFTKWSGRTSRSISQAQHKAVFSNTADLYRARIASMESVQNWKAAEELLTEGNQKGYISDAGFERGRSALQMEKKMTAIDIGIQRDADVALEKLEKNEFGLPELANQRKIAEAKRWQDYQRREISEDITNQIVSGDITTVEEIEKEGVRLTPRNIRGAKKFLVDYNNGERRAFLATEPEQNRMIGDMDNAIYQWNPNGEPGQLDYQKLLYQVELLNDGPIKETYKQKIKDIQNNKKADIKTIKDWGRDMVDSHGAEKIKKIPEPKSTKRTVQSYMDDGFFNEETGDRNLERYFDDEKIRKRILGATETINKKKVVTQAAQMKMFKAMWNQRSSDGNTEWDREFANAINTGSRGTIIREFTDPEKKEEYDNAVNNQKELNGARKKQLENWLRTHPDPKDSDLKTYLKDLNINIDAQGGSFYKPRPGTETSSYQSKVSVPRAEGPANVRYNNPGAAYPRKQDEKYGVEGYGIIGGGHKIAKFPTPVHGAAANFDLFADKYTGMTFKDAMKKWRGRPSPVPKGYSPNDVVDDNFLNDPNRAIDFFKKMALHESPDFKGMTDDDWRNAWQMWKSATA